MTLAKRKADELIEKFDGNKQHALICVEELISEMSMVADDAYYKTESELDYRENFWQAVKTSSKTMSEKTEVKRPNLRDYYPNIIIQSEEMIAAPKLLAYAKALEQYVKHLQERKGNDEVTDEKVQSALQIKNPYTFNSGYDTAFAKGFIACAKWMRSKLTNK